MLYYLRAMPKRTTYLDHWINKFTMLCIKPACLEFEGICVIREIVCF